MVDSLVNSGKYKNSSEVVREGQRLLEQRTAEDDRRLELLKHLAAEGFRQLDQGEGIRLGTEIQIAAHISNLGRQAAKRSKNEKYG